MEESKEQIKQQLKVLLLHLAAESEHPGSDLQNLMCEVVEELYLEAEEDLANRSRLTVVRPGRSPKNSSRK